MLHEIQFSSKSEYEAYLRDYFAAAALQGLLAGRSIIEEPRWYAEEASQIADAMIAERNKRDAQD